ncbi:hypothetical protein GYH30_007120 [Glycine max]|nr:hypothetical protein GYH30_007120 [Glycine max]
MDPTSFSKRASGSLPHAPSAPSPPSARHAVPSLSTSTPRPTMPMPGSPSATNDQVIIGVESRYRAMYCLVNGIYVLGITVADHDNSVNLFECIHIVNQAVSIVVTVCCGIDVTP